MGRTDLPRLLRLRGAVQPYAWGGHGYIADLVGLEGVTGPVAEYWLGAHPSAPSRLALDGAERPLDGVIAADPEPWLGAGAVPAFPFLFKVLDVAQPLSIQVHPDLAQARAGFDREDAAGIPRTAPERSFRDPYAKPELAVALEPFWLLFGLAEDALVAERLAAHASLRELHEVHRGGGAAAAFEATLRADERTLARWLTPLLGALREPAARQRTVPPEDPSYWLRRWLGDDEPADRVDRGVLGFLLMNILELAPGEGIFQGPGVPHAYLSGRLVELMTCSDNVLRCGLTPKHVDPEAVLAHVDLAARQPTRVSPVGRGARLDYPCPVSDFQLARYRLTRGQRETLVPSGPTLLFAQGGGVVLGSDAERLELRRGEAALVRPATDLSLTAEAEADLFLASGPG